MEHSKSDAYEKRSAHPDKRTRIKEGPAKEGPAIDPATKVGNQHAREKDHTVHTGEKMLSWPILVLSLIAALLLIFNQVQIGIVAGMMKSPATGMMKKDLTTVDLSGLKSTGHTVAAVFPVESIKTSEDAMAMMFPTGTPEYGEALGVSFDDPVGSLSKLSKMYPGLKAEVQKNNPQAWARFMNMASKPLGMDCEYCCGVGTVGVDSNGNSKCGCQHNPAILAVGLYLTAYTNYSDGEILRETMRWKTLFFPKKMVELAMTVAGGDTSKLGNLPGMVGGC